MELTEVQSRLAEAESRIKRLEEQVGTARAMSRWLYLVERPHRWRRQLCIKGRNMTVGQLVSTLRANRLTPEQASDELQLPLPAIHEALAYFEENRALLELEAAEERRRLAQRGYPLEPSHLPR